MTRTFALLLLALIALPTWADEKPAPQLPTPRLVLPGASRGAPPPVIADALEASRLGGTPTDVKEGDGVTLADGGVRNWVKVAADKDGAFKHASLRGGYLRLEVEALEDRVMIFHASGFTYMAVNGEPR